MNDSLPPESLPSSPVAEVTPPGRVETVSFPNVEVTPPLPVPHPLEGKVEKLDEDLERVARSVVSIATVSVNQAEELQRLQKAVAYLSSKSLSHDAHAEFLRIKNGL